MNNKLVQPKTLPGFMELLPQQQILFNKMIDIIKRNYEKYGFLPLDTPIIESADVLLAKAGGETEKQIYSFTKGDSNLCLRFDLTVPLAKYVALHYNDLTFPFRRYQIGKVYRGERPQKGRFREFYQCDIDVIGNNELSIIYDAEMPSVIYNIFNELNIGEFVINFNNRKLLKGLMIWLNLSNLTNDIIRIIDKYEKIGEENVRLTLIEDLKIEKEKVEQIIKFINISGTNKQKIEKLNKLKIDNEIFKLGLSELSDTVNNIIALNVPEKNFEINLTISRGLDYYTGTVYETFLTKNRNFGSICSGGRYDNLAEFYTDKKLPGVGISIGITRLFDVLMDNNVISATEKSVSKVLVVSMLESVEHALKIATSIRNANINCEVCLENTKFKNKLNYANKLGIPYVVIIGEDELKTNTITLKNMISGEQQNLTCEKAISLII